MVISIKILSELRFFAEKVAKSLRGGETLGLIGELGAGKTTFSKMLLKSLGVKKSITSPTFVLMIPYLVPVTKGSRIRKVFHMDLYRLKNFSDIEALGTSEAWSRKENVHLIEWADKIKRRLPKKTIFLNFEVKGKNREIKISNAPKYFKI